MRSSDAEAVAVLCGQLGYPATTEQIARRWSAITSQPGQAVFVAVRGDRVVGWLHAATRPILEFDLSAEIWGLVVDETARGSGIGRMLLEAAEQWAVDAGCGGMRVRSRVERSRAHAFYEREGYSKVKTQHVFEKPLASR
jgi:GNAT superfamily N-acetyltransferase